MTSARIIASRADLDEGAAHLVALDPRFGQALEIAGPPPLRRRPPGFAALFQVLVGQQVSVAAAAGIWQRIEEAGVVTPGAVLARDDEALRALGLSRPKVRYARAIADAIESGSLCLDTCAVLPVDEAISSLTQIKGIGPWTAEIYLMFCVGHADVFASKDLALQEAARLLFGLDARPTHVEMAAMAEAWTPWRAVAARILWSYYRAAKGREGVAG